MHTLKTTFEGRAYEIDIHPERYDEPMCRFAQFYRVRKDGSRGMQLMSHRPEAWNVWEAVKAEARIIVGR